MNAYSRSRVLHHDARAIKYYYRPEVGTSLSGGFETFQQLDDGEDEHLDGLLACVSHLEQSRKGGTEDLHGGAAGVDDEGNWKIKSDFMTWRGMMTKIMAAPYSNFDGSVPFTSAKAPESIAGTNELTANRFEMNATLFDVR